jgi:hypothetical protein
MWEEVVEVLKYDLSLIVAQYTMMSAILSPSILSIESKWTTIRMAIIAHTDIVIWMNISEQHYWVHVSFQGWLKSGLYDGSPMF